MGPASRQGLTGPSTESTMHRSNNQSELGRNKPDPYDRHLAPIKMHQTCAVPGTSADYDFDDQR
jgi:hypothetical protein